MHEYKLKSPNASGSNQWRAIEGTEDYDAFIAIINRVREIDGPAEALRRLAEEPRKKGV